MRQMKDSGIEWIGKIPQIWSLCRIKNVASICNGREIETEGGDIPVYGSGGIFKYTDKSLYEGESLLLGRKGTIDNPMIVDGAFWTVDTMFYMSNIKHVFLKYLYYFCLAVIDYNYFKSGCVLPSMTQTEIRNICFPYPPVSEQQKIADFLDGKCAKIDSLIAHEEAMIEELKAYKQSVITEAFTKGLDESVPMKISGVEWIGLIPEHWNVDRLKNILTERNEKNYPIKTTERLSLSIDLGVTLYADKTTNLDRFKDDFTQYKIAYPNDLVLNSMNMIVGAVGVSSFYGCVSPAYYVLYSKAKKDYISKYFYYLFKTKTMNRYLFSIGRGIYAIERGDDRVNTCRLKVSRDDLNNLLLPIPPDDEILRIIKKIEEMELAVENLIRAKQQKIEELKEYKKSLIYEYVTGKKQVA